MFVRVSVSQDGKIWRVPVPYYGDNPEGNLSRVWELVVETHYEAEGYDGWYNNRAHPDWGGVDMPMLRRLPHAYADGVYQPSGQNRPNPIEISRALMNGSTGMPSLRNRTAFLVFFGQQVVEEVLDAQRPGCPPEFINISIPMDHPHLNPLNRSDTFIPLQRSRYDQRNTGYSPNSPREQLNEITPWIDGGLMYGIGKTWADALRSFSGGRLKSTTDDTETNKKYNGKDFPAVNDIRLPMANPPPPRDHYLKNVNRFFRLGNPRGNENPFLLTFGIFWYRYHNRVADRISELLWKAYQEQDVQDRLEDRDKGLTDDEFRHHFDEIIFNEARKWVIATHQKIIVYDWLPSWLGTYENGTVFNLPPYKKYDPNVYPQIMHVFQSAAMRFGHTLVPPGVYRRRPMKKNNNQMCEFPTNTNQSGGETEIGQKAVRTCNSYWNPQDPVEEYDIDDFILGMSSQVTEKEDTIITPDLRGFVFGGLDFNRRDLMAINIQRGRDHGLPDYNTARKEFGLDPITDWGQILPNTCNSTELIDSSPDCWMIKGLREVYNNSLDDIDIWPGGLAETTGDGPGPLFQTIIADQFQRIRDGDRFWYENPLNGLFNAEQTEALNRTTLRDIILQITDIDDSELAGNPFFFLTKETKCERIKNRAASEGLNTTSFSCGNTTTCSEVEQWLMDANPDITVNQLRMYADCANNTNFLETDPCPTEAQISHVNNLTIAECTPLRTFDYFTGSEWPYILTFLAVGVFIMLCFVLMYGLGRMRISTEEQLKKIGRAESRRKSKDLSLHEVSEWQGKSEGERDVKIKLDIGKTALLIYTAGNTRRPTRTIDCKKTEKIFIKESIDKSRNYLLLRFDNDYDLVLKFDGPREKNGFVEAVREFCNMTGLTQTSAMVGEKALLLDAVTKAKRKAITDKFFRIVCKHAFRIDDGDVEALGEDEAKSVISCELTIDEFADRLSLKPDSLFVRNMFDLIDKDKNGTVSFREFLDMMVIFAQGSADKKSKLLFDMYDVRGTGQLSKPEFRTMIRSMMELANTTVEDREIDAVIDSMFENAGMAAKQNLTLEDFNRLLRDHKEHLDRTNLNFQGMEPEHQPAAQSDMSRAKTVINNKRENAPQRARKTILKSYGAGPSAARATRRQTHVEVKIKPRQAPSQSQSWLSQKWNELRNNIENYRLHIFWITLYTLLCIAIFAERFYYFSYEREHVALRRIAGYGVSTTRGAASGQMFTYCTLLLTMCRNVITHLRESFLHRFIPFDSAISFHKYVAVWALIFTAIHVLGHTVNFYHIATQLPSDLTCLFRNFYRATHVLPKFHYWCWGTITGFTGVLLTLIIIVMYVFALQYSRKNLFKWFWNTHQLFYVVFILMVLHGAGILVQEPLYWTFFIVPGTIFTFDKLISLSRNKREIAITKAELLPSDVTALTFKRPAGFDYKSGQWVRIACVDLGESEYHPFTLTSAPHEDFLSLHIRALGPWTKNIRTAVDPSAIRDKPFPKLYLDGPFGEGHQDWYKYEVAVLVGGGIGVTPFASILKDIVNKASAGAKFPCKKVYFMWVCRSQKQYEWMVDIIRDVEENDKNDFVSVHIFITQFFNKFDLRTTMLYICERHFQRVSNRSLFTGLRSITHFGRPDFSTFLSSLKEEHPGVSKIGVFSCGNPQMTRGVEDACSTLNKKRLFDDAAFVHHFENF